MPRYPIDRATNFIVEEESWTVVEYDHTSVPGVIYLSLTEGKINLEYDNLKEPYADEDKLAVYKFLVPEEKQTFTIDSLNPINPTFTLIKNGFICNEEVEFVSTNYSIVDKNLCAVREGDVTLRAHLKNYPQIQQDVEVSIVAAIQSPLFYISGNDKLHLDCEKFEGTYTLKSTQENMETTMVVTFVIKDETGQNNTDLAKIISQSGNTCVIKSNNKNILGVVKLIATYDNVEYTKDITIIPLW